MKRLLGGAGAALSLKLLSGFAVAAAAVVVAGAATEVAVTGSLNPTNWGQQVTQQVNACKASAARLGVHGIGECVSDFAKQHGDQVSDSHQSSKARDNGKSNGKSNGKDNGKSNGKGNGNGNANGAGNSHKPSNPGANSESSLLLVM